MLFLGIIIVFLFGQAQAQASTQAYSGCSGYMFLGENSVPTCNQHIIFLNVSKNIVEYFGYNYYSQYNNGFAAGGFGAPDDWKQLVYGNKSAFISTMDEWIGDYSNGKCSDPEDVNYT